MEMHEREFEGHIRRTREGVDETTDETSATIQPALEKAEGAFAKFDAFLKAKILNAEKLELTPKGFYDVARPATASLVDLSAAAYLAATNALNKRLAAAAARRNITAGIVGVALVTALALTWLVTRSMTAPMAQAISVFRAISAGMYNNRIEHKGTDEASEVLHALDELQQQLLTQGGKSDMGELRIKSALDKASARLLLTDESLKIIYLNDSAQRFLHEARGDLQRDLPQLDVGNIIGESADAFFGNRLAQRRGHDQTLSYETDLRVGARAMKATAQAIVDRDGKRIGICVELLDQSAADAPFKSGRVA
jgi:PAS domain-containing protein